MLVYEILCKISLRPNKKKFQVSRQRPHFKIAAAFTFFYFWKYRKCMENIYFFLSVIEMTRLQPMRSPLAAPKKKTKNKKTPHASFTFSRVSDEKPDFFFIWPKMGVFCSFSEGSLGRVLQKLVQIE